MKLTRLLAAAAPFAIAACATAPPTVYGPGPAGSAATTTTVPAGYIAECNHPGARRADVMFPEGWQERLSQVAQKSYAGDELLGGPVTTEVVERDAQPIKPPVPTYPAAALSRDLEAQCFAMFNVSTSGMPEELLTACSSPEFNASALSAAKDLRFSPKTVDGRKVRRLNVVYPFTYCIRS